MKRATIFLVISLIVSILISGCTGTPTSSTTATPTSTDGPAVAKYSGVNEFPIVKEKINLTLWAQQPATVKDMETNKQTVWYEEKTNVHIDWVVAPSTDVQTKLNLSLASKDYPDIYWNVYFTPAQIDLYGKGGVLLPLNNLIEKDSYYIKQNLIDNPQFKTSLTSTDGNIYTFWDCDFGVHMQTRQKMFVYKPWLDALKLSVPTTTDEFTAMLQAFKDQDPNGNGKKDEVPLVGVGSSGDISPVDFLMNSFQLTPLKNMIVVDGDQFYPAYTTDGWRQGLRYLSGLYDMGLLAQETFVQDADQLKSMVNKSSPDTMIVGAATGFWQGVFVDANILTTGYADYVPVLPLKGPSGLQQMCKTNLGFNLVGAITTACKTPEIAIKWVDYWMSFDGSMITSRGWEGLNYEWVDTPSIDGQAKSYRRITDRDQSQNSFWYVTPINDSLKRRYSEERKEGKSGTVMYDASVAYLPFTKGDGWPSILWPSAEQTAVVSLLEPTILDYVNQSIAEFILGKKSIDNDWESYLNDLKQMGLDDYIKIQKDIVSGKK